MVTLRAQLQAGINSLINKTGKPIRIRYFTSSIGSVWDDNVILAKSGNDVWTSGIELSLNTSQGSYEATLMEQGKLITNDIKLFTHGSLFFVGSELSVKIQVGSPGKEYTLIPPSIISPEIEGVKIYKKLYLRQIGGNGSLLGE